MSPCARYCGPASTSSATACNARRVVARSMVTSAPSPDADDSLTSRRRGRVLRMTESWHRVAAVDVPDDGRVRAVVVDGRSVALARCGERLGALENRCPHQGGPLGEGSIEKGWLRCPWHGYDYRPTDGTPPPGFTDAPESFPVEVREDGVYVSIRPPEPHVRTVSDVMVETMVAWGVTHVFGMV